MNFTNCKLIVDVKLPYNHLLNICSLVIQWRSIEEKINNIRDKTFDNFSLSVGRCLNVKRSNERRRTAIKPTQVVANLYRQNSLFVFDNVPNSIYNTVM